MKRATAIVLAVMVLLSATACSRSDGDGAPTVAATSDFPSEYVGEWKANTVQSRRDDEIVYRVSTLLLAEDGSGSYNDQAFTGTYQADTHQLLLTFDRNNVTGTLELSRDNGSPVIRYSYATFVKSEAFVAKDREYVNAGNTYSEKVEIEISLENWDRYFEIVEKNEWVKNAFQEAENWDVSYYLKLKDEYQNRVDSGQTDIAVEIQADKMLVDLALDLAAETASFLDHTARKTDDFHITEALTGEEIVFFSCRDGYSLKNGVKVPNVEVLKHIEVVRIQGTLFLYE